MSSWAANPLVDAYHLNRVSMDAVQQGSADINTYIKAVKYIASLGGYAIRVGQHVSKLLPPTNSPCIIDCASKHRTDFLDLYLAAKCRFFLAPPSGTSVVPMLYGAPTAMANQLLLISNVIGRSGLYIPNLLRKKSTGYLLPFVE